MAAIAGRPQLGDLPESVAQAADAARQLRSEQVADPLADFVEGLNSQRPGHALQLLPAQGRTVQPCGAEDPGQRPAGRP